MSVYNLDHIQIAIPPNQEAAARAFYGGVLGLSEIPKPPDLAKRGGVWFALGALQVHLGVEQDFRPAKKAHPAFLVHDVVAVVQRCKENDYALSPEEPPLSGYVRTFVFDPFGNRIELMQKINQNDLVQQRFGPNAAAYATSANHAKGASLARVIELVQPQAHWRALDVATGAGHMALAVAPHVAEVVASDLTPQMLDVAANLAHEKGLTNVCFELANAEALPFEAASFDLVTCRIAPHHFADVPRFVRECARVLKPSGVLAIVDNITPENAAQFVDDFERARDPSHLHGLSAQEWVAAFTQAGVSLTHHESFQKRMIFDQWVAHQNSPPEVIATLQAMLHAAPAAAKDFLAPEFDVRGAVVNFYIAEGIFIGQR
jgi:ubiquinone/menaquinone biosynthesis C-methylase UbiE/catechol 2,3-dioxygenase-like lactoylglutathione lyase family enzyme